MHILKSALLATIAAASLAGCTGFDFDPRYNLRDSIRGKPHVNDNVFLFRNGGNADDYKAVGAVVPNACLDDAGAIASDAEIRDWKQTKIEDCTRQMMLMIKQRSDQFQHDINASLSTGNFLLDTTSLGLTLSAPLVASGTAKVLSAIAAGVIGSRKNFDEDFLYSYSLSTIMKQMRTDQAGVETRIIAHLSKPGGYATMYEASLDLYDYEQASSWDHAMGSLEASVAAQTAACEARTREQKLDVATGDTALPAEFVTASGFDPCNPPKYAPGPTAVDNAAIPAVVVPFANGSTTLGPKGTAAIQAAIVALKAAKSGTVTAIEIEGMATGTAAKDLPYAQKRADAVEAALLEGFPGAGITFDKSNIKTKASVNQKLQAVITFK
jgi:outer membrane protein OmpA-like peptidoglycan-associated protein